MVYERLSLKDDSLISSYAESILRYEFALEHCRGKCVLDAGCGTGYGAYFLAANDASFVLAVDVSDEAIAEAKEHYRLPNLTFKVRDVELLGDDLALSGKFETIVNFENLAHLSSPERLIGGVAAILLRRGTFIVSTPNGEISELDKQGNPLYRFHHRVFTADELNSLLSPHFGRVLMYGQWLTYAGMLRKRRGRALFEQLSEAYYNPMSRVGRMIKRVARKRVAPPPLFTAAADSFFGDYAIHPLESSTFKWPPTVLIAVCEK